MRVRQPSLLFVGVVLLAFVASAASWKLGRRDVERRLERLEAEREVCAHADADRCPWLPRRALENLRASQDQAGTMLERVGKCEAELRSSELSLDACRRALR